MDKLESGAFTLLEWLVAAQNVCSSLQQHQVHVLTTTEPAADADDDSQYPAVLPTVEDSDSDGKMVFKFLA